MAIDAISATTASPAAGLGMQDLMKILLTQLTSQDPLKPMDSQQFMTQMAQFTALEQTRTLNDKLDQLIANQAALQSVGLIGRSVELATASGNQLGTVTGLSLQGSSPQVTVTTSTGTVLPNISLAQIVAVR